MSDAQERSYNNLAPLYCLSSLAAYNFEELFGNNNPVIIEIGFGSGHATASIAEDNPELNYLGIEVYRPGIGHLLWEIDKRKLNNIRIIHGDAAEILDNLPLDAVEGIHIFFPDPWPKKRHHKRRLITRPFTALLKKCLKTNGYIYMVTDWVDYADWALAELTATPGLQNKYENFALPQSWRPETRFEKKGLDKKHEIRELFFIKSEE